MSSHTPFSPWHMVEYVENFVHFTIRGQTLKIPQFFSWHLMIIFGGGNQLHFQTPQNHHRIFSVIPVLGCWSGRYKENNIVPEPLLYVMSIYIVVSVAARLQWHHKALSAPLSSQVKFNPLSHNFLVTVMLPAWGRKNFFTWQVFFGFLWNSRQCPWLDVGGWLDCAGTPSSTEK